jgi:16S rRNA (guanine1207-N2)-methyltransferase
MSIPKSHYFEARPAVASRPRTVRLKLPDLDVELESDRGVFGAKGIDLGTRVLLREAPPPPSSGDVLDLGCGYGPIAIALARRAPGAQVWAVDVNERAVGLARANAARLGLTNLTAATPAEVPAELAFDAVYSNPPVRVGKAPLHRLLETWIPRMKPGAPAYLVVQRNLGSDSLAAWLAEHGWHVARLKSKKGYRVLEVRQGGGS